MPIFTGKTADGSDMHEVQGMYVSPCGKYWSSEPYAADLARMIEDHEEQQKQIKNKDMGIKGHLAQLLLASAMMSGDFRDNSFNIHTPVRRAEKVIPKGCKEYSFGHHPDEQWSCIAINKKSARKKYNKWLDKQQLENRGHTQSSLEKELKGIFNEGDQG